MSQTPHVLIADDEALFRDSLKEFLAAKGYACTCASDAPEAARLLSEQTFDLLISDIAMPGNSELQLIREVQVKTPWIPIILVTGYPSVETAVRAVRLPVYSYLLKPIEFSEILPLDRNGRPRSAFTDYQFGAASQMKNWNTELDQLSPNCWGRTGQDFVIGAGGHSPGGHLRIARQIAGRTGTRPHNPACDGERHTAVRLERRRKQIENYQAGARCHCRAGTSKNVLKSMRLAEIRKHFQDMLDNLSG